MDLSKIDSLSFYIFVISIIFPFTSASLIVAPTHVPDRKGVIKEGGEGWTYVCTENEESDGLSHIYYVIYYAAKGGIGREKKIMCTLPDTIHGKWEMAVCVCSAVYPGGHYAPTECVDVMALFSI